MTRSNQDLAKFKFFLTCLQDTQGDQQNSAISQLIVMLVSSEITPEEFYSRIQNVTNDSLEEFHLQLMKTGLPLLRKELNTLISISQGCNGHSTPPLHTQTPTVNGCTSKSLSDGEIDSITPDIKPVKRVTSLTSTMSGLGDFDYSLTKRTSEVSLKHRSSASRLDSDNLLLLSPDKIQVLVQLAGKLLPLLQEFADISSEALPMETVQGDASESDSNDSSLHIAESECYEYDQAVNGFDTPQEPPMTPCANCNRRSVFRCVCQTVCYCSTFCRDKNREAHRRDCFETSPSSSSLHTLTLPQTIYIERPNPGNIMIQDGNPVNSNGISPTLPTSIYIRSMDSP